MEVNTMTTTFKDAKNILCAGSGGVGSYVAEVIAHLIQNNQLSTETMFTFVDYDIVEKKNILYQNFLVSDITTPKAMAIQNRYKPYITGANKKIESEEDIKEYDAFIICVDSNNCRKLIVEHCAKTGKPFIDGRAEGNSFAVYSDYDGWTLQEYLNTLGDNGEGGSCQLSFMLENQQIDLGNRIVAPLICQVLLNRYRGIGYPKNLNVTV
jgi:molybdopterin/thiamine biosynthesis adenylyltransferase